MGLLSKWKGLARKLALESWTLYYAYRNPKTPCYAKALAALIVAYAFSPIDLIPDFVPVLGYLDDLILIPLGITLAIRLIPKGVYAESRELARRRLGQPKPRNWLMGAVIIAVWVAAAAWLAYAILKKVKPT
jgi:uncharacterized membrane protein YkvA (DUF1232 family)